MLKTLRTAHPRLILTESELHRIRKVVSKDPIAADYASRLAAHGEAILKQKPVERVLIGPRLLSESRKALDCITTMALLYKLDGDRKWADRAIVEMRAAAAFSDWNPSHYLDVAEMTTALAFGYDWLYGILTPQDRTLIKTAIVRKGLNTGLSVYREKGWWTVSAYNWNNVCNGGMIVGALAVADEEPALAAEILSFAQQSLPKAMVSYAPDGAWGEGPGYWAYATRYTTFAAFSLQSALGTDWGIMAYPGMRETGYFPCALTGPSGYVFNFADAGTGIKARPLLYALARWYKDPAYAYLARVLDKTDKVVPFDLIWYDSNGSAKDIASRPLDYYYKHIQVAVFRSSWTDTNAVFVGFKAGDNAVNHSHLDLGSFILESNGVRWADELGPDDYNMPGYFGNQRWTYYRLNTAGHNTLLLDGKNQDAKAKAPITTFTSKNDSAFVIADLTAAYASAGAVRMKRGMTLYNDRRHVLVQDEIHLANPADIVWAMHTHAAVKIDMNGRRAELSLDAETLTMQLLSPAEARFNVEEIKLAPPQRPLENERKLIVHLPEKTAEACITVLFTPGSARASAQTVIPLDEWK